MGILKRIFGRGSGSSIQDQVDAISREEFARKAATTKPNPDFDSNAYSTPNEPDPVPQQIDGGLFAAFAGAFTGVSGVREFVQVMQSGQPFFAQINTLATQLDPTERTAALAKGLNTLPSETIAELGNRLHTGASIDVLAQTMSDLIGGPEAVEGLIMRLGRNDLDPSASLNLVEIMRDPVIRETAKAIVPPLVDARKAVEEPPAGS